MGFGDLWKIDLTKWMNPDNIKLRLPLYWQLEQQIKAKGLRLNKTSFVFCPFYSFFVKYMDQITNLIKISKWSNGISDHIKLCPLFILSFSFYTNETQILYLVALIYLTLCGVQIKTFKIQISYHCWWDEKTSKSKKFWRLSFSFFNVLPFIWANEQKVPPHYFFWNNNLFIETSWQKAKMF